MSRILFALIFLALLTSIMLNLLSKTALVLQPLQKLILFLSVLLVALIIFTLVKQDSFYSLDNHWLKISFLVFMWLVLMNLLTLVFNKVPSTFNANQRFSGVKYKIIRFFYHTLAWLFMAAGGTLLILSFRMINA
jgi:membrane-associated HD superfamily phosphohydrolase